MSGPVKQAINGIVFNPKRTEVLLIQRRDVPVWVLPGGGLEPDESPAEGVVRELFEETGYRVEVVRKVAEYLPVNKLTQFTHFFECRVTNGDQTRGDETKDVRFFPLTNLPKLMPPPYASWIQDAIANAPTLIRKKVQGVSYWVLIKLLLLHPILVGRFLLTKMGIYINSKD